MRKSTATIKPKELPQGELEDEFTKRTSVPRPIGTVKKGRTKNMLSVPSGETGSGEICDIISDSIQVNAEALEWHFGSDGTSSLTARQWAEIILRAIRYGIPYEEYQGEGFHIQDDEMGEPALCSNCQEGE